MIKKLAITDNSLEAYEAKFYALFINEAAYYEKGFAMTLAQKKMLVLKDKLNVKG